MTTEFIGTENKTGWIVYYITDSSGSGFKTPHYEYYPSEEWADIHYQIIEVWENWALHARSYSLKVEMGVIPPIDVIEKEISNANKRIKNATEFMLKMIQQKDDFHGGLVRN
jgi:hypothetical protein